MTDEQKKMIEKLNKDNRKLNNVNKGMKEYAKYKLVVGIIVVIIIIVLYFIQLSTWFTDAQQHKYMMDNKRVSLVYGDTLWLFISRFHQRRCTQSPCSSSLGNSLLLDNIQYLGWIRYDSWLDLGLLYIVFEDQKIIHWICTFFHSQTYGQLCLCRILLHPLTYLCSRTPKSQLLADPSLPLQLIRFRIFFYAVCQHSWQYGYLISLYQDVYLYWQSILHMFSSRYIEGQFLYMRLINHHLLNCHRILPVLICLCILKIKPTV